MEKVQTPKHQQQQPKSKRANFKPILQELGTIALKGIVTGVSVKLGGMAFDKTFNSKANLTVINGGRSVANG